MLFKVLCDPHLGGSSVVKNTSAPSYGLPIVPSNGHILPLLGSSDELSSLTSLSQSSLESLSSLFSKTPDFSTPIPLDSLCSITAGVFQRAFPFPESHSYIREVLKLKTILCVLSSPYIFVFHSIVAYSFLILHYLSNSISTVPFSNLSWQLNVVSSPGFVEA